MRSNSCAASIRGGAPARAAVDAIERPDAQPASAVGTIQRGYTLIEMIIVMAIISVLVAIAVPMYQKSLLRTKESLLKNNLFTMRTVIDEYTFDKQKAPQTLQDLVDQGYLRTVPLDPMTGNSESWRVIMEDAVSSVDQTAPGIYDVRSGSDKKSLEGTMYSEW
ncbi:MAG TPA: type II secretion system protein [Bryobacteraceae bacterium]|nr:type II secretion system protein [Bryobacteraceae bacterium]